MLLFIPLFFVPTQVLSELVPSTNVNFITRSGYKYIGAPEVTSEKGVFTCFHIIMQKNITLSSEKNAEIICSHHCILNQDSSFNCNGYFVEGSTCHLVSDSSKVEKDGVTNNYYMRRNESPIPTISVRGELKKTFIHLLIQRLAQH